MASQADGGAREDEGRGEEEELALNQRGQVMKKGSLLIMLKGSETPQRCSLWHILYPHFKKEKQSRIQGMPVCDTLQTWGRHTIFFFFFFSMKLSAGITCSFFKILSQLLEMKLLAKPQLRIHR